MTWTEKDKQVIKQYEQDEAMMIFIFAQWCVNHEIDAVKLYEKAYPDQPKNKALYEAHSNTVPKDEAESISTGVVQHVLQLFGNDDLAFAVQEIVDGEKAD